MRVIGVGHGDGTQEQGTGAGHWSGTREWDTRPGHGSGTLGRGTGTGQGSGALGRDKGVGHSGGSRERATRTGHWDGTREWDTRAGHWDGTVELDTRAGRWTGTLERTLRNAAARVQITRRASPNALVFRAGAKHIDPGRRPVSPGLGQCVSPYKVRPARSVATPTTLRCTPYIIQRTVEVMSGSAAGTRNGQSAPYRAVVQRNLMPCNHTGQCLLFSPRTHTQRRRSS